MDHDLLHTWALRRVLLAGEDSAMMRAMEEALCALGARCLRPSAPSGSEPLFRALHEGRTACVIVPSLASLCAAPPGDSLAALDTLLLEAREAGVPLVMLIAPRAAEVSVLLRHAQAYAQGFCGDPMSIQRIITGESPPQEACLRALALGARFLAGERRCTGIFALKAGEPSGER